jgi:hypothetical protein
MLALFPFQHKYSFWTGACSQSNPAVYAPDYFADAGHVGSVQTNPAEATTIPGGIFQPPVKARLQDKDGNYLSGMTVFATLLSDEGTVDADACKETYRLTTFTRGTDVAANRGYLGQYRASGTTYDPGLPFGKYRLCAKYSTGSGSSKVTRWQLLATTVDNTAPAGATIPDFKVTQTASPDATLCPA